MKQNPSLQELISLQGRRVLITGAASGIGRAVAHRMAEAGAELELVDRDQKQLVATARELEAYGQRVEAHAVDLADRNAIEALWEQLRDRTPDTLINNAAVYPSRSFTAVDEAFYRRVMGVNLEGTLWMCRRMIQDRGPRGGVIINIGSIEALLPFKADLSVYSTSKAAVIALTRALAREYARHGFRINALLPGWTRTPGTDQVARRGLLGLDWRVLRAGLEFHQRLPVGRPATPDEIARMVLVLASDLAAYVHGAVIPVDGGFLST